MSSPNDFIKVHVNNTTCFCSTQCRNQAVEAIVRGTSERLICREYHRLNDIENQHLDQMWQVTLNRITTGVALYYSATRRAGLTSFGPSMAGEPEYFALPQRERTKLCKNINRLKRIHERWETIAHNLTNPTILHIDVRRMSVIMLEKSINFDWVREKNEAQNPNRTRRAPVIPHYPAHMIDVIFNAIQNTGILDIIQHDDEQIKLIGRDLVRKMQNME